MERFESDLAVVYSGRLKVRFFSSRPSFRLISGRLSLYTY
jgi:hypothetical protein